MAPKKRRGKDSPTTSLCKDGVTWKKKSRLGDENDRNLLQPALLKDDVIQAISTAYRVKKDYTCDSLDFSTQPFPHWCIKNLITDNKLLERLRKDLLKLHFEFKSNDLFKFSQSKDIYKNETKTIAQFREVLFTDVRSWLEKVLDISLAETVDMSCAQYKYTDFLLCHDDKVEDRQIAFIYYLVPPDWSSEDGGRLDLFDADGSGHPSEISKSLIPAYNSLVFFEVNDRSYHQVSEVLSQTKTRLSISGWFHSLGDPKFHSLKFVDDVVVRTQPIPIEQEVLLQWINPQYLHPEIAQDIQKEFEENSEIQLPDFLKPEKYKSLLEDLRSKKLKWKKKGPPNKRLFWSLVEDSENNSKILSSFLTMLRSEPFFKLLRVLTDLELALLENNDDDENDDNEESTDNKDADNVESTNNKNTDNVKSTDNENVDNEKNTDSKKKTQFSVAPSCIIETRQWKHGCFTILDDEQFQNEDCLDCIFNIGCEDWEFPSERGYISYVAGNETEELVTVEPIGNCLSLVYRDEKTTKFIRYMGDDLASDKQMFDVDMMYFEGKIS